MRVGLLVFSLHTTHTFTCVHTQHTSTQTNIDTQTHTYKHTNTHAHMHTGTHAMPVMVQGFKQHTKSAQQKEPKIATKMYQHNQKCTKKFKQQQRDKRTAKHRQHHHHHQRQRQLNANVHNSQLEKVAVEEEKIAKPATPAADTHHFFSVFIPCMFWNVFVMFNVF